MKTCAKCLLPDTYPAIKFNNNGVCNFCVDYKPYNYLGPEALRERISSILRDKKDRNSKYDCVISLSGGRDSSYLLYYFVIILKLKVVAYSVDNGFIPQQTLDNLRRMTQILKVDLIVERHNYLQKCFKHYAASWCRRPSAATVGLLCTGCRLGLDLGLMNFLTKNRIPLKAVGGTPFEGMGFKLNLLKSNPESTSAGSIVLGYLSEIARNPKWLMNFHSLNYQAKEYYYHFFKKISYQPQVNISPFHGYIKWNEKEIIATIQNELEWKKNPESESTWRGDCDIATIKNFLYKRMLGFNDKTDGLSCLIRDNQVRREEAVRRLQQEDNISEKLIENICIRYDISYSALINGLNKYYKNWKEN
jgi:hypothetical protein